MLLWGISLYPTNALNSSPKIFWGGGAGLIPWAGGPPGSSFGFYLREAFQSQPYTEKILYNESR